MTTPETNKFDFEDEAFGKEEEDIGDDLFAGTDLDLNDPAARSKYDLDEGYYEGRLIQITRGESDNSGNPMLTWTFLLTGNWWGEDGKSDIEPIAFGDGTEWKVYTVLEPANAIFQLQQMGKALDVPIVEKDGKARFSATKSELLDSIAVLRMKKEVYEDEMTIKVKRIKRHPDGPKVSA